MIKYENFSYIYPPRPKNAVPISEIQSWDNGLMIAQPKINGSNCVIFMNGVDVFVYNRHNQVLTNYNLNKDDVLKLYSGKGWMVLNGEYLNKAKSDENLLTFNHKLIIFDIIVYNSMYLVGQTFQERISLLDKLYGTIDSDKSYLFSISENIYRVKSYTSNFREIFDNLTKIDMIEGLVMKRKGARLEVGTTENNNTKSQIKFRKPTKNYKF